ncbi:MAG: M20/M25/M40 family metallo-hydrolase, partial [Dokdonella sp.]
MSRNQALALSANYFDDGHFLEVLSRRVAVRTESQNPSSAPILHDYLSQEITPELERLGFTCRIFDNPRADGGPLLLAERLEPDAAFTVLTYGHGDVVRGQEQQWREDLNPWVLKVEGDRWYGRGTADNKGQHTINLTALDQVLALRQGKLGYNVKIVLETGEEVWLREGRLFDA